jgi:hypothetical protein
VRAALIRVSHEAAKEFEGCLRSDLRHVSAAAARRERIIDPSA